MNNAQAATLLIATFSFSSPWSALAQTPPPTTAPSVPSAAAESTLKAVIVKAGNAQADVTGLGDLPSERLPLSTTVIDANALAAIGARRLADAIKLDASVSDAYNTTGYWDYATVRGFVLDNKFNYRREGLPISAETFIPLDNKERIEILKGTSGIQAGTSAPGGLINYAVKRPTNQPLRAIKLEAASAGSVLAAADLGGRFGNDSVFGYRFNVASEKLNTATPGTRGTRELAALALDWRIGKDSLLEAEIEHSRRSQPSVPGLSLLGNALPAPNPTLNLSVQPWALPVVLQGFTGSLRFEQALNPDWRWSAQWGTQRLKSQDRSAFPFGCSTDPSGNYIADRYCANGDFDLYDFRSENEQRNTKALQFNLKGKLDTGGIKHDIGLGLLSSHRDERYQMQAYNYVATSNVANLLAYAPDPSLTDQNTNRTERNTELSVYDTIEWARGFSTWLGLRNTHLQRASVRTNGSRPTDYSASITTPWLATSWQVSPDAMVYASWGQGIESQIVPNKTSQYSNPGAALPALKSRQSEVGVKGQWADIKGALALFNIRRPMTNLDACNRLGISPCLGGYDGSAVHSGLEASAQWAAGNWTLGGAATWIKAKREGSIAEPLNNGQRPTNVPGFIARANAGYRFAALPGLSANAHLSHEGTRNVLPDGTIALPAWTRVDAGVRYDTKLSGVQTSWTLGIDNLFDRRFFKESPYQFGHVYLFPQQARTLRLGFTASL